MGTGESRVTGRSSAEGASGRYSGDHQRAEEGRRWSLHVFGEEQARAQREEIGRRRSDR